MAEDAQWLDQIEAVVAPVLASRAMSLVDSEWRREGRRWVLRLFVDKPGGVGIADCQAFSREAGDVLDVSGLIEPAYDLEVSSPGLDRVLKKDRELAWAVGREVRYWVREPVDSRTEFVGRLAAVTGRHLTLAVDGGATREVPRQLVTKARLDPGLGRPRTAGRK